MNRGDLNRILERAWNDWWPNHLGQPLYVDDTVWAHLGGDQAGRERVTEAFAVAIEHALAAEARGARGTDIDHRAFEAVMREARGPEVPKVGGAITGQFGVRDGSFSDASGVRCASMLHAGNLLGEWLRDEDKAKRLLDLCVTHGYHGTRWWTRCRGDWWKRNDIEWGQEITPHYWERMRGLIEAHRERGLVFHTGAGDLRFIGESAEDEYIRGMAALANDYPESFLLFEYVNEARDTDDEDSPYDALRDMAVFKSLTQGRILTALSAYTGHEDKFRFGQWTAPDMAFVIVHPLRDGRWWDKIRHLFSLPYEDRTRDKWYISEPWGVGPRVSAMTESMKAELTRSVYGLAAWMVAMSGGVWTDFYSPGVILGNERFEDYPQFGIAPIMAARAEAFAREHGLRLSQLRLTHGNPSRDNVLKIVSGHEARIDQAIDDAKGVCLATVYGPEGVSAKSDGGYTWTWVNPETGELVENVDVTRTMKPGGLMGVRR